VSDDGQAIRRPRNPVGEFLIILVIFAYLSMLIAKKYK
jgi:hypothetical protein